VTDCPAIDSLIESCDKDTLTSYGRFTLEEYNNRECFGIRADIMRGTEIAYGYFENGKLLGYLHFNISNKASRLGYQASMGIVVHPSVRRKGVADHLLDYGLEEMRKLGYKKIWLHVHVGNMPAIKLYEKHLFEVEGMFKRDQVFDGKIIDVFSMAKFL
jgi:ribosomal protein S18 acetylase RimI-like enzyme